MQSHSNPVTSTLEGPEKANFLSVLVEMGGVRYQLSGFLLFLLGNGRFRSVEQNPHQDVDGEVLENLAKRRHLRH